MADLPAARKLLLIGWDAADWKVITPLLDAGKLPHLQRLIEGGVMGNLATLYPELSPMLWTSIATGKRPFKHGVLGFTEPDPAGAGVRPVSILSRKTKALWNMLGQSGRRCHVVGWWPSHPAEPINGVMVSNHYQRAVRPLGKPWPLPPGCVHPERLREPLAQLRLHPAELGAEHILPFVPRAAEIDQKKDRRLASIAKIIAECSSVHAAATAILQLEPWDFLAVYYDAIDHFCHGFMRFHPPRPRWVPERDFELYQGVVEAGYRYHDMMLGMLLHLAGAGTTVMLVSDHGFHPDHLRPRHVPLEPAGPAVQHRPYGVIVLHGPGIRRDERVYGASLLDVAPTVLTLCGLPVGEDMDGKPLVTAWEEPPAVTTIPSWDTVPGEAGLHPPERQADPLEARAALQQLIELGYIERPPANREAAARQAARELRYNLARSYLDARRHGDAIPLLEQLLADWPDEYRFGIHLVGALQAVGRPHEARQVLDGMLERKETNLASAREKLKAWREKHPDAKPEDLKERELRRLRKLRAAASRNPAAVHYLRGMLLVAERQYEAALVELQAAARLRRRQPDVHVQLGELFLRLRRHAEAGRSFQQAALLDPENPAARLGLCRALLARRQDARAAEEALAAVNLLYFNPSAHFYLGVALHRLRAVERAVEAFRVAVQQAPGLVEAHRRLALLYERRLHDPERAAEHRRLAQAAAAARAARGTGGTAAPADAAAAGPASATVAESAATLAAAAGEPVPPRRAPLAESVIVVSGLPRSGTSMMMQMLAAGGLPVRSDGERAADADNPQGYLEYAPAKRLRRESAWLAKARGQAVKIVAQLLPALPPAHAYRVILMERDLDEVLASQRMLLARHGRTGAALPPERLKEEFRRQLAQVRQILTTRGIPTLVVGHRDCITAPAEVAARVHDFLDGVPDTAAMAAAVRPGLYRQRAAPPGA